MVGNGPIIQDLRFSWKILVTYPIQYSHRDSGCYPEAIGCVCHVKRCAVQLFTPGFEFVNAVVKSFRYYFCRDFMRATEECRATWNIFL